MVIEQASCLVPDCVCECACECVCVVLGMESKASALLLIYSPNPCSFFLVELEFELRALYLVPHFMWITNRISPLEYFL
jgi:hypothetical protein